MDIEQAAIFDTYWRKKGNVCGYEEAWTPGPSAEGSPDECPVRGGVCPAGPGQAERCKSGKTAVMSDANGWLRMLIPVGRDFFEAAQSDWRGGIRPRTRDELERAVMAAWMVWNKMRAAEDQGLGGGEDRAFACLHWLVIGILASGAMSPDEMLEIGIFTEDNSYFERLAETDWGLEHFLPDLGDLI